jgi:cytochrome c-type biogenesis protein CcmH/NrfG
MPVVFAENLMNRFLMSGLLIGVFAGFLAGYFVGAGRSDSMPATAVASATPPGSAPSPMPQVGNLMEAQSRIASTQAALDQDPRNERLWIALGNDYFDTRQFQNAIDAYGKALAISPDNPDVLTDQGVMYREIKSFDRAVSNFKRAAMLNPKHLQSLFNLGVVYAYDLHDVQRARETWEKLIRLDPSSAQAGQARSAMQELSLAHP